MESLLSSDNLREESSGTSRSRLQPLRATTLADQCYAQLKDAILTLELRPGAPLSELQIANQFGISKSPVREAFQRLHGEGLVQLEPNRRCVVNGLERREIREWYELRLMLEPASLRRTVDSFDDAFLLELRQINHLAIDACNRRDPLGFVHYSDRFHLSMLERNPNRALIDVVTELFHKIRRVRIAIYQHDQPGRGPSFTFEGLTRHERILDRLDTRDSSGAVELLAADLLAFIGDLDNGRFDEVLDRIRFRKSAGNQVDATREEV